MRWLYGVLERLGEAIKNFDEKKCVKEERNESEVFSIHLGLWQGCVTSTRIEW